MSCGRLSMVLAAIVLLFPGLCFIVVGVNLHGPPFTLIGVAILGLAVYVAYRAFREPEPGLDESNTVVKIKRPTEPEPPKEPEPKEPGPPTTE